MPWLDYALTRLSLCLIVLFSIGFTNNVNAATAKPDKEALIAGKAAMRFTVARVCESTQNCQEAILAEGWITQNTLELAKAQAPTWPAKVNLIFNSDGGDLLAAMDLGRWIRANQLNTRVGAPKVSKVTPPSSNTGVELSSGRCLSACVLSFMGGTQRVIDPADIIGFHGLVLAKSPPSTNQAPNEANAAAVTELDKAKLAMNAIGRYLESMGGDRRMVDFMLFAKGEQFQRIPYDSSRQLGIDNQIERPLSAWRLQAIDDGELIALVSERQAKGQLSITLAFTKPGNKESASDNVRFIVFVKPVGRRFQAQEIQAYFTDALTVKLISRKNILRGKVLSSWKPNADGMQLILSFPTPVISSISQTLGFELEIDFPESFTGSDRITKFGTQGLKGALTAIRR